MRLMSIIHSGEPRVALDRAGELVLLPGVSEIGPDTPLPRLRDAAQRADQPVATISQFTELECGDLILTGTPAGVGYRRDPQLFLGPGDRVQVTIESLGTLTNRFVAEGGS